MRGGAAQAATASGVNHTVRLPRARRPASYAAQLVTRCCCFGMWRRQAALALNGTAEIQASGKEPPSYTAQLPTPTGRSLQQGGAAPQMVRRDLHRSPPPQLCLLTLPPRPRSTLATSSPDFPDVSAIVNAYTIKTK